MITDIKTYNKIERMTKTIQVNEFAFPRKFIPTPMLSDYNRGIIERYFAIKVNDKSIIELDKRQYDLLILKSKYGIDFNLYKPISLKWKISGQKNDVYKGKTIIKYGVEDTNRRTVESLAKDNQNIKSYFKDLLEFFLDID